MQPSTRNYGTAATGSGRCPRSRAQRSADGNADRLRLRLNQATEALGFTAPLLHRQRIPTLEPRAAEHQTPASHASRADSSVKGRGSSTSLSSYFLPLALRRREQVPSVRRSRLKGLNEKEERRYFGTSQPLLRPPFLARSNRRRRFQALIT